MPMGDGTGPGGSGAGMGRGRGMGRGGGMGLGRIFGWIGRGLGRGRMGGPFAAGPGGDCVCPKCGRRESHERGVPCAGRKCPQCGAGMTRG
jgi:hypothetical protein